jgi:hypothetical protein
MTIVGEEHQTEKVENNNICHKTNSMKRRPKNEYTLSQGSQTRGPRAACVPPDAFVRPANIPKTDTELKF